jgi:peptide/nickel transport system permease protein
VTQVILKAVPYDIALLLPAICLSWYAGNKFGAFAARSKRLDNTVLPVGYILTATPYMWLALCWPGRWALSPHLPHIRRLQLRMTPQLVVEFVKDVFSTGSCPSSPSSWSCSAAGPSACAT